MKLLIIFGTRPELIKLAPVMAELRRQGKNIDVVTCSTGQHQEMLDQALDFFGITPDINLAVMQPDQTLSGLTSRLIEKLDGVLTAHTPDAVLVQGDTTSAFAGALAAFYHRVPVGHVEAGLRTGDLQHPFPEEFNRSVIARLARWNFAPTALAADHLRREGIAEPTIHVCGNTVIDAVHMVRRQWQNSGSAPQFPIALNDRDCVLVTTHRRENFGEGMLRICDAIRTLCQRHNNLVWIFPVHLNPQVREPVFKQLKGVPNLYLIDPLDYETTLYVQSRARLVITDSGGIQEEASVFGVPVVIMREYTERMEGVKAGFATLAGTSAASIIDAADQFLRAPGMRQSLLQRPNPYGDGQASERIVSILCGQK